MEIKPIAPPKIIKHQNFIKKQVTLAPPEGKLLTYKQIREFCKEQEKKLPKGSKIVIRGENILRTTTLYSTYNKKWDTDEEWDEYLNGAVEEPNKFKAFFNFTVTLKVPT